MWQPNMLQNMLQICCQIHDLIWVKIIWKLAMQICHRCALKDQVLLIAKTSATELAHPLMSRHARLAANILWPLDKTRRLHHSSQPG